MLDVLETSISNKKLRINMHHNSNNLDINFKNMMSPFHKILAPEHKERFEALIDESRRNVSKWGSFFGVPVWLFCFLFDLVVYPEYLMEIWSVRAGLLVLNAIVVFYVKPFDKFSPFAIVNMNLFSISAGVSIILVIVNDPNSTYLLAYMLFLAPMGTLMNLKVSEALGIILMVTGNYTLAAIIMPAQIDPTTIFVLFTHSIIIGVYAVMASRIFTLLAYKTLITTIDNEVKTNSIEKQHIELKALDNAKTELLSNISHEFRTPLTLILSPVDSLENNLNDKSIIRDYLTVSKREGLRLLRLVNNLLDSLSHINKGESDKVLTKRKIVINDILTEQVDSFSLLASAKNIQLNYKDVSGGSVSTLFDKHALEKVISNILMNAVKYTHEGKIDVVLETKNNKIVIKVIDTGIGIGETEKEKVFERFKTGSNARNSGAGIGLSLTKSLMEEHDGEITLEKNSPRGTVAKLVMPIVSTENQNELVEEDDFFNKLYREADKNIILDNYISDSVGKYDLTVIVIDDEINMRGFLVSIFDNQFNVLSADNGADALNILENKKIDLAIVDYMLPDTDGISLVKKIKKRFPEIKTIMLTANQEKKVQKEAVESGIDEFFVKPFSRKELIGTACNLLNCQLQDIESIDNIEEPVSVLIMEDSKDVARLIESKLPSNAKGYIVSSIKEAAEYIETKVPDIITIDITLSDGNGLSYITKLKNTSNIFEKTKLIGISGDISEKSKLKTLKECDDFIAKPFNSVELELRLKNHIDNVLLNRKLIAQNNQIRDSQDLLVQREKLAILGELSMSYMHEIKNPLNYALSAIQFYDDQVEGSFKNDDVTDIVKDIKLGLGQINNITKNLRNYSYNEIGKERIKTSLEEVIQQSLLFVKAKMKDIDVQVICSGIYVLASMNELIQVFVNLINNSINILNEQEGDKHIFIKAIIANDEIEVVFSDNGPGVDDAETHKLYDKFYSTKEKTEGTGLGLSICRTIIEGHGGTMEYVGNDPGAVFKITLPKMQDDLIEVPKEI